MLAPRKGLLSNLNHVHLQHVSLGVHLSLRADLKEGPLTKDPGIEGVTRSPHRWKEETNTSQVDPNSNDPSVPCLCCDEHSKQVDTCNYNCQNNVELITNDVELQSPCDLPLSPLSPSSPSTDSSSSSDFTLDDSPVSMYYKEFCQDDLESPDQQPDIIPLDAANEDIISSTLQNSMWLSPDSVSSSPSCDEIRPNTPEPITPENLESHNKHTKDAELLHFWETNSALDANCNTLPGSQPLAIFSPSSGCLESEMVNEQWEQKMTHAEMYLHKVLKRP
ncbi:AP-4 complex accessory subunit RUSC1-like [Discoglossus pictus]